MLRHYPKPNEKEISWHLLAGIFTLLKLASYLRLVLLQKPYLQAKQKQNLFFFYLLTIWGSFSVSLLFQANIAARFALQLILELQDVIWKRTLLYRVPTRNSTSIGAIPEIYSKWYS